MDYNVPMNLSDPEMDQMAEGGISPDKLKMLQEQLKQAQTLKYGRNQNFEAGTMAGRTYVPNIVGAIANGYQNYKADKQIGNLEGQQADSLNAAKQGRLLAARGGMRDIATQAINASTPAPTIDQTPPDVSVQPPPNLSVQGAIASLLKKKKKDDSRQLTADEFGNPPQVNNFGQ